MERKGDDYVLGVLVDLFGGGIKKHNGGCQFG